MEDEQGYATLETSRQNFCTAPAPNQTKGSLNCCKIALGVLLALSVAVNVGLIILLLVFQMKINFWPSTLEDSCEWIPGVSKDYVTFDPDTAHLLIAVSRDRKTAQWGKKEQPLPNNTQRFDWQVWVLGQNGFLSGKHCWEVEVKGDGEWGVGVARESVKRKGKTNFSTNEGIWGIGEYAGIGNYLAFTAPQHTKLSFDKKPRRIRVFLDYSNSQVELFNAETQTSIFTFNSASFSGERVFPWFRLWEGTGLKLHP